MILKIFLKAYLIGVICGLLFPVIDMMFCRLNRSYREDTSEEISISFYIKSYRETTIAFKLIAALFPVLNLIWIAIMLVIIRTITMVSYWHLRAEFIIKLACSDIKKHFKFKHWIVKTFFKKSLDFFYKCITEAHSDEIADALIKAIKNAIKKKAEEEAKKAEDNGQADK